MDLLMVIGLAFGLAMDAFAVAVVVGLTLPRTSLRPAYRLSFHFGLFQFLMPVVGWVAGLSVARWIADYDHWAAFALLSAIGAKMIWEARGEVRAPRHDPTRGFALVALSVATSIDALAAGVTLALEGVTIWLPGVVIGVVAAGMTLAGFIAGRRVGIRLGRAAWIVGGLILIALGLRILLEHLAAG
jgi:putative Mn2+ efflux pump MntP